MFSWDFVCLYIMNKAKKKRKKKEWSDQMQSVLFSIIVILEVDAAF